MPSTQQAVKVAIDRYISSGLVCSEKIAAHWAALPEYRGVFIPRIFLSTCAIIHRKKQGSVSTKKEPKTNILSLIWSNVMAEKIADACAPQS